jgi:hypothetical protein
MRTLLLLALPVAACTDAFPCTSCPDIAGTYVASWSRTPGFVCAGAGPRPTTFSLTQVGEVLRSTLADQPLQGTLFDTYDFTLSGDWEGVHEGLWGRAALGGAGTSPDAGTTVRLQGTLTTSPGDGGCLVSDDFTADRAGG